MSQSSKKLENISKAYNRRYFAYASFFVIGSLVGLFFSRHFFSSENNNYFDHISSTGDQNTFSYLRPYLGVDAPNALTIGQYKPLYSSLKSLLENDKAKGSVIRYSVYFRDLNNGLWIGLNENDKYDPASLLKISSTIAVYKQQEADPSFLKRSVEYTQAMANFNNEIKGASPSELKVGNFYTIDDLIKILLIQSDNGAKDAIMSVISNDMLDEVFKDMGLPQPEETDDYKISSRNYALFFRTLYNASYLSRSNSEEILKTLSDADFTSGLVAGVPKDVKVSHKYGEYLSSGNGSSPQSLELHDCGIVYHPSHPYIACIMTEGTDETVLKDVIKNVSQVIYSSVDGNYRN